MFFVFVSHLSEKNDTFLANLASRLTRFVFKVPNYSYYRENIRQVVENSGHAQYVRKSCILMTIFKMTHKQEKH
jgi:hypothetical protein